MESLNSNSQERELHQLQQMQDNAKETCMTSFQLLHSFLQVLSYDESKSKRVFERAFMTLFGQDYETFTSTIEMIEKLFAEYTGIKVKQFKETLLLHMGNVKKSVAERTQCNGTKSDEHITSSCLGTYITHVVDADIRAVNHQEPSAEVHLTAQHNVLANEQQHIDQFKQSYDTYLLEKVDSNTTLDSTNMCHRGGEINQDAKQDQGKSSLLKAEFLKTNYMVEKEVYNELPNRFLQLEKHCISLEISMQQKEESFQSNKPSKFKHDIDVIETIHIELEHKVAKLLKENETFKKHYKDLYDSIKVTRTTTIEQTTSLIAKNDEFKAQLQEKGFTIAALKNKLRKLTRNSVNTKFAKPSILGKLVLQPLRNQSVVRQPTAYRSERPKFLKPRFSSQVDVNNVLSKPVTLHYLPKVRESVFVKPNHVIASDSSRNSTKESYGSNDMAHNYYLEEAKKKTQNKIMNLKPSVMHTTSLQNTTNGRKPKPRSNNQTSKRLLVPKSSHGMLNGVTQVDHSMNSSSFSDSKHFVCSTCQKCVFNANHDDCITKFLKEASLFNEKMASADNTSVVSPQSKERCTLQCVLSLKEEKASYLRAVLSTTSISSHARSVNNSRPDPQLLTPGTISSGFVPQPPSPTPNVPPTKNDWDTLLYPMFDGGNNCDFRDLANLGVSIYSITILLYTSSLLYAACKKYLNLLKKELLVQGKLRPLPFGEYRDRLQIASMDKITMPLSV
nr:hypothetical protein [Tanacetum cinerariifolium]